MLFGVFAILLILHILSSPNPSLSLPDSKYYLSHKSFNLSNCYWNCYSGSA